jgi:hypothetical protein
MLKGLKFPDEFDLFLGAMNQNDVMFFFSIADNKLYKFTFSQLPFATLDSGNKIPIEQIPDAVLGQVEYKGTWNASTNSPTLPTTPAKKGDYYVVSTAGTRFGETFAVGDWCISNGTIWQKVDNTDAVMTVFGRLGNVVAQQADYEAFYSLLGHTHAFPVTSVHGRTGAVAAQSADYQSFYSLLGHTHTFPVTSVHGRTGAVVAQSADYSSFYILLTSKGQANGVATLDSGAKIPTTQIPDALLGQVEYKGTWNASTNSPTLPTTPAIKGDYYVVNTAGTQFSITFAVGDWCISNGTTWEKVDNTDAVMTVFGRLGNIIAQQNDYSAFYSLLGHVHSIAEQIKDPTELVVSGGATTLNCANFITAFLSVTAAITLNISNMRSGMYMDIRIVVTGTRTITLGTLTNTSSANPTRIGINGSLSNMPEGHYHIGFAYLETASNRYLDINIAQY